MNRKATYEITITEKLGQLQVPDMRGAIWSRIEQQLDLDLPGDDDPEDPDSPGNGSWRNTGWKVGPFAVIVAIVTIFFINKNKQPLNRNTGSQQPQNIESPAPQKNGPPFSPMRTQANDKRGSVINASNTPGQRGDSAFTASPVLFTPPDTTFIIPKNNLGDVQQSAQPPPPLPDSTPKKSRGVKGITDKDYHITLKKDSVP